MLNRLLRRDALAALLALSSASAWACPPAFAKATPKAPARSGAKTVYRARLANGLRVILVRDPLAPVVTTEVNYLAGADDCPPGFPGTAHAQEHMMFRGSPGLTGDQLTKMSALMGGDFDADTRQSITQYYFTIPAEDLDVALHIEALRMRGVDDSQKLWNHERGAIEQEVAADHSNPEYLAYLKLRRVMFAGTPYARTGLGTRRSFNKTTAKLLKSFHDKWYYPDNAVLIVAGDIDPQRTMASVRQYFGSIPGKAIPAHPAVDLKPVKPQTLSVPSDLPYDVTWLVYRAPGFDQPKDYAAATVLSDVLSSQRGTFYNMVPQGKALGVGFSLDPMRRAGLAFAEVDYPKGADGKALIADAQKILAADAATGVPADLVAAAKRREVASAEFAKNSIEGLADAWSQAVAEEGRRSPDDDVKAIEQVTPAAVDRLARQILDPADMVTVNLVPRASGKPASHASFGGGESFASSNPKDVKLPAWAEASLSRLSLPPAPPKPVDRTLPNGLRVIFVPNHASKTVVVEGQVQSDPRLEESIGQDGVDGVLGDLFSYGTTTLNRVAYQRALDNIGAIESAGRNFSLEVLAPQFDRGMQLLADNLLHPALPLKAFKVVQQEHEQEVAGELQSPKFLTRLATTRALVPPGDPALRHATPRSVARLTLADVRGYYRGVFRPDLTTIVIIGDITAQQARAEVTKYFGDWEAAGPRPATLMRPIPLNHASKVVVPDSSRVQDKVTLGLNLEINRWDPGYYALRLGNEVLGGGFNSTRLTKDLRENGGLVYYVFPILDIGLTRSFYEIEFGCDPKNVTKARAIVERDIHQMQTQLVTPAELKQAKTMVLRSIPLSLASVADTADTYLELAKVGLPLDEPERAARHYLTLTRRQLQDAFARWIPARDMAQIVQGPDPR